MKHPPKREMDRLKAAPRLIVVGDLHGTYEALEHIMQREGLPSDNLVYVFNGDYVDRGSFSIEVYSMILALKIMHPTSVYMLRGNHETREISRDYTFFAECIHKYGHEEGNRLFDTFCASFQWLPLGCCIDNTTLVVHGGICGRDKTYMEDIARINRVREPAKCNWANINLFDPLQDILWSDPAPTGKTSRFNAERAQKAAAKGVQSKPMCKGVKKNGDPCTQTKLNGAGYCRFHVDQAE
ncbi:hypothetical protein KIPB_009375 [Kipferlia bialata]|uniref:Serine/threonine-protein phosphatase n=1 Tax=Kipferlia bialata TaxID=797122 RepID=A0A9K3D3V1_9EUKA|nr:hypothetical protein KIPB_009375 [Kipferlia bialata]|eukprot:g9375.t1